MGEMIVRYKEYVNVTSIYCDENNDIRYCLEVELENCDKTKTALVIMKNPSKADKNNSDQTVNTVLEVMYKSGYGKCYIMNLIPYYATDSAEIAEKAEEIDEVYFLNDQHLKSRIDNATRIFVAWGGNSSFNIDFYNSRIQKIKSLLEGKTVYCYKKNQNGAPIHPSRNQWKKDITDRDFIVYNF